MFAKKYTPFRRKTLPFMQGGDEKAWFSGKVKIKGRIAKITMGDPERDEINLVICDSEDDDFEYIGNDDSPFNHTAIARAGPGYSWTHVHIWDSKHLGVIKVGDVIRIDALVMDFLSKTDYFCFEHPKNTNSEAFCSIEERSEFRQEGNCPTLIAGRRWYRLPYQILSYRTFVFGRARDYKTLKHLAFGMAIPLILFAPILPKLIKDTFNF